MVLTVESTKICPKCSLEKTFSAFPFNRSKADGRGYECKDCQKRYRESRRDELRVQSRLYNEAHRHELRLYGRSRYELNKDRLRVLCRERMAIRLEDPEIRDIINLQCRKRYSLDPWRRRRQNRERFHRVHRGETEQARDWREQVLMFDLCCSYCGEFIVKRAIDHINPDAGGDWDNLTTSCAKCNLRKGQKSLLHFLLAVR